MVGTVRKLRTKNGNTAIEVTFPILFIIRPDGSRFFHFRVSEPGKLPELPRYQMQLLKKVCDAYRVHDEFGAGIGGK